MKTFFTTTLFSFGVLGLAACSESGDGDGTPTGTGGDTGPAAGGMSPNAGGSAQAGGQTGVGGSPAAGGSGPGAGGTDTGAGGAGAAGPGAGGAGPGTGGAGPSTGGAGPGTGGSPGSGGGGPDVPEPTLVTSGPGSYWNVGEVTDATGNPGDYTVNTDAAAQPWLGWGGTFNEHGWSAMASLSEQQRAEIMQLLFSETDGIGFDWGRIPMGPSDYAVERYTLSSAPGEFDITHDEMYLIPFIQAAQAIKGDVKYWASPWSPPPWAKREDGMTLNGGYDKGIFDSAHYQDYANYFVAWVTAYEDKGIPIDHVQPQNEPGWSQGYPTCAFGPATDSSYNNQANNSEDIYQSEPVTLGPFVADYLKPALDATSFGTKIWFGTLSNGSTFDAYWNSLPDKSIVEGIALQWETVTEVASLRQQGVVVMQSEHKCGNYPWLGNNGQSSASSKEAANRETFWAPEAPNNYNYGVESWDLIKQWIDDGVSIYSTWNMVLDTGGFNLDEIRPWPQNALIAVDRDAGTYQVTPYYYVFRHVAQYVDAGATKVGINGNALAFQNPDGSVVAVVFNDTQTDAASTVDIGGTVLGFTVPAGGWATINWQG